MKNLCYQDFGSSGNVPVVIGNFVVDTMLLKIAMVPRELFRVDDFASDAVILCLASNETVKALLEMNSADVGNKMVRVKACECVVSYKA